jgi:hypothetical protein
MGWLVRVVVSLASVIGLAASPGLGATLEASPAAAAGEPQGRPGPITAQAAGAPRATAPDGQAAARADDGNLPVSLDRIRRGLERKPTGVFNPDRPTFQVYIEGRLPTFAEFYAGETFEGGPSGWVPRGHQEFLDMVTPPEAQPFGAFTGTDLLLVGAQSLATGLVANALFNALPRAIREGQRSRAEAAARREVQEVLAELARREAVAAAAARKPSSETPSEKPVP